MSRNDAILSAKRARLAKFDDTTGEEIGNNDIFANFPVEDNDLMVKKNYMREYYDLFPADINNYCFSVGQRENEGTDLRNCFVEIDLQVFKENGNPLTEEDKDTITPANDLFNALFAKVIVDI